MHDPIMHHRPLNTKPVKYATPSLLSWIQQASSHQSNPSHQSLHTKALNFYSTLLLQTSLFAILKLSLPVVLLLRFVQSAAAASNLILQCTLLPDSTSKSTYPRSRIRRNPVQKLY
ncbi:hypothetical protein P8452_01226 [Trifolium repens]|nr:hypothetical protein P8452_01226 [Trifolium repens]